MKKIYLSLLFLLFAAVSSGQSTPWMVADSFINVTKPGSGPVNPVWNVGAMPLLHTGTSYVAASTPVGGGTNTLMDHAYFYSFGLTVPDTVIITGVEVMISRFGCNSGNHSEDTIFLAHNGVAIGNYITDTMSSAGSTDTLGGSAGTWGNSLTPAMVNSHSFGIYFDTRTVGTCTIALQDCRMKVHYANSTGVNSVSLPGTMILSPNPASSVLRVQAASPEGYIITDCMGKVVLRSGVGNTIEDIDITSLASGLYYIRSGNKVDKFIKK